MKIRTGLVSNSSSSSFVVRLKRSLDENGIQLSADEIEKLLAFGFKPAEFTFASTVESSGFDEVELESVGAYCLCYSVSCNQDEVVEFLVGENIPFEASCHYGQVSMFFTRGAKTVLELENPGLVYEMYGPLLHGADKLGMEPCRREIAIEEILGMGAGEAMKIRDGLVSNSSSSSFILALQKKSQFFEADVKGYWPGAEDLLQSDSLREHGCGDETHVVASGVDDVVKVLMAYAEDQEKYSAPDESDLASMHTHELISKIRGLDQSAWAVAEISVSYHDYAFSTALRTWMRAGFIKVLDGDW